MVTAGLVLAAGTLISPAVAQARSAPERLSSSRPSDAADPTDVGEAALRVWRLLGLPRNRGWYAWWVPAPGTTVAVPAGRAARYVTAPRAPGTADGAGTGRSPAADRAGATPDAWLPRNGSVPSVPGGSGSGNGRPDPRSPDPGPRTADRAAGPDVAVLDGAVDGWARPVYGILAEGGGPVIGDGSGDRDGLGPAAGARATVAVRSLEGVYAFAGGRYFNHERRLPAGKYYEYDVYPRNRGAARDGYRLVVDASGGSAWFSPNHYLDFHRVA